GAYANLAVSLNKVGRVEDARKAYEDALVSIPDSPAILKSYANFEASHENFAKAEELFRQIIKKNDQDVAAAVGLAMVLRAVDRKPEAEAVYRAALSVNP